MFLVCFLCKKQGRYATLWLMKAIYVFWVAIVIVIAGGAAFVFWPTAASSGQYDALAQCSAKNGVKFYGAYWCPHCQRTKALFGSSASLLPYVECSTADGQGQTQICKDNNITGYPTWVRSDGSRMTGENTLAQWAAFSGCTLSGEVTAFSTSTSAKTSTTSSSATQ